MFNCGLLFRISCSIFGLLFRIMCQRVATRQDEEVGGLVALQLYLVGLRTSEEREAPILLIFVVARTNNQQ